MDYKAFVIENARREFVTIDAATERARRELLVARNAAYSRQQWADVDRLTQILKTFPVKRSDGTYEACASTPEADEPLLCTECGHARQNATQASACCTMQGSPCPECVSDPRD